MKRILFKVGFITAEIKTIVDDYIASNKVKSVNVIISLKEAITDHQINRLKLPYIDRLQYARNKVTKASFLQSPKKKQICTADLTFADDVLNLAEQVGPYICCLKTRIDIIEDFHPNFVRRLQEIAEMYELILMEHRKFTDIGKTVQMQYTEARASGTLMDQKYTGETLKIAFEYDDLIVGVVRQSLLFRDEPGFLQLIPGLQLGETEDNLGQQYNSPEKVIVEKGGDIKVVGWGITQSENMRNGAKKLRICCCIFKENLMKTIS
ncbi:hypothetical protein HHI36_008020 [Cryptolaemus montrouzieri]|uniref:Orotidine 5'-phosphate decarboxylase domain-containing protein n=1 Tax=Cryptolaemus montrouzieri TaxID=559131 RepID=A0ABD2MRG1_9CUCU